MGCSPNRGKIPSDYRHRRCGRCVRMADPDRQAAGSTTVQRRGQTGYLPGRLLNTKAYNGRHRGPHDLVHRRGLLVGRRRLLHPDVGPKLPEHILRSGCQAGSRGHGRGIDASPSQGCYPGQAMSRFRIPMTAICCLPSAIFRSETRRSRRRSSWRKPMRSRWRRPLMPWNWKQSYWRKPRSGLIGALPGLPSCAGPLPG